MNEVERWSIESLIKSKPGVTGKLYNSGDEENVLLDFIINTQPTISTIKEYKFATFIIEGGAHELFTLTGYSTPIIWYSLNYVGKYIKFRTYIMDDPENNAIDSYGISNLFETVSGYFVSLKNYKYSIACLLQSIIEAPSRINDNEEYEKSSYWLHGAFHNRQPNIEALYTSLYFGLAHEMGHTYGNDYLVEGTFPEDHPRIVTKEEIIKTVESSAKSQLDAIFLGSADYQYNIWHRKFLMEVENNNSILSWTNLKSEILADFFGFNILVTSINSLLKANNQVFNIKVLLSEVILGIFIIQLLETCKFIASNAIDNGKNPELLSIYIPISSGDTSLDKNLSARDIIIDFQIAHRVRLEYLKPSLSSLALIHLFPDTFTVNPDTLTSRFPPVEIERRHKIAADNVTNYINFYSRETTKLMGRTEDVLHFVSHLATNEVPRGLPHLVTETPATFMDLILNNFDTYLGRLKGKRGIKRKQEILDQLLEYNTMVRNNQEAQIQVEQIISALRLNIEENKK